MKKLAFTLTLALLGALAPALLAHEEDEAFPAREYSNRQGDPRGGQPQWEQRGGGRRRLASEIQHLNRMLAHVRGELRTYGAGRHIRSEYALIQARVNELNYRLNRGVDNPRRALAAVERIHNELRHVEQELHVRANDYYQWR